LALFCKNDMNLAAEEKIDGLLPLAAAPAFGFVFSNAVLPKTRVGVSDFENQPLTGASAWLSSTSRWGCGYRCDGTASVSLVQRFYASTYGRFNTPDPYQPSGGPSDPGSWNRYSYVFGDPINLNDPDGLFATCPSGQHVSNNRCVPDDGGDGGGDNPGGGVGRRPVQRPVKKPSPDKPTTGATLNGPACSAPKYAQASSFINANLASAQVIASQLNTTPGDILGLAGLESGWGTGFLITAGTNNYFSLTAGPAFGGTIGTYQQGSYTYGVYTSFLSSGESFANSYFGVRVEGITNPLAFATALNTNGSFNSETTPTAYDQTVANTISLANTLLSCSQATGATQ
jgi:RHS repeat-associated protein